MRHITTNLEWSLTMVYGPTRAEENDDFLQELADLQCMCMGLRLLIGDFNVIYRAEDKNNARLNQRCMGQFQQFLNKVTLK
jgi:hypothetical protein